MEDGSIDEHGIFICNNGRKFKLDLVLQRVGMDGTIIRRAYPETLQHCVIKYLVLEDTDEIWRSKMEEPLLNEAIILRHLNRNLKMDLQFVEVGFGVIIKKAIEETTAFQKCSIEEQKELANYSGKMLAITFLPSINLSQLIQCAKTRMPESICRFLFKQIVEHLAVLHEKKVVHCDMKPDNVLIMQDGSIRLIDFGLSRLSYESFPVTCETAQYTPPEYYKHNVMLPIPFAAKRDIFALGGILFSMIFAFHSHSISQYTDDQYKYFLEYDIEQYWKKVLEKELNRSNKVGADRVVILGWLLLIFIKSYYFVLVLICYLIHDIISLLYSYSNYYIFY